MVNSELLEVEKKFSIVVSMLPTLLMAKSIDYTSTILILACLWISQPFFWVSTECPDTVDSSIFVNKQLFVYFWIAIFVLLGLEKRNNT